VATGWSYLRIDDCDGNDSSIGFTTGSDVPVAADCTQANNGFVSVCWDQVTHLNPNVTGPACAYKTTSTCTGGMHPGYLYWCNHPNP
jgi:hypothetical protein